MDDYRKNVEQRFNRIVGFFYCLMIIGLPISNALVESMAGFVIFFFVIKKVLLCRLDIKGKRLGEALRIIASYMSPQDHSPSKWIGLYILAVFMSVIFSQYPSVSLIAFVAKLLEGYFLYYSCVDCIKTKEVLRDCLGAFLLVNLVLALDGIFQYLFKVDFLRQLPLVDRRVSATLRHANDFGAYLSALLPFVFAFLTISVNRGASFVQEWGKGFIGTDRVSKNIITFTFILMVVSLGLTFSRGSWIAFWISLVLYVVISRKHFVRVLVVSLFFMAVFLPFLIQTRGVSFTTDSVNLVREYGKIDPTPENLAKLSELERARVLEAHRFNIGMGRFGFWEAATGLIEKHPLFGSGLNTYSKLTTVYAHNCYLQMAAEIGLLGLLAFLIMIVSVFRQALRSLREIKESYWKALLIGLLTGFAGFLIQSFFDTTLYSVSLGNLMWVLIGLIGVVSRVRLIN